MANQFRDTTKKVLSPQVQAVLDAHNYAPWGDFATADRIALAAALRAAASQLTSAKASDALRAIAAELEGAS
jgi:hypothetical protein